MRKVLLSCVLLSGFISAVSHAADFTVDQNKERFNMDSLTVKVGDNVSFTNSDTVKHNLTVVTPEEESNNLGTEAPGAVVKYSPPKKGTYDIRCKIHPTMKMKIKVEG
jgi:plastocyanin